MNDESAYSEHDDKDKDKKENEIEIPDKNEDKPKRKKKAKNEPSPSSSSPPQSGFAEGDLFDGLELEIRPKTPRRKRTPKSKPSEESVVPIDPITGAPVTIPATISTGTPARPVDGEDNAANQWSVVIWNDPIHYFPYIVHVLRELLSCTREQARKAATQAHEKGDAVVWIGGREEAEFYVCQLQRCMITASLRQPSITPFPS